MKEEMTSADVAALVAELSSGELSLIDAKVGKIYQPLEDGIRLNLFVFGKGRVDFIIQAGKRAHLSQYASPSPKVPQSFPMLLRKHVMSSRIVSIKQYDFDRIIEIGFVRGGVETVLVAELFARGNIVLIDNERRIILPMNPATFKGRRVRSGEIYTYPEAQINPLEVNEEQMLAVFSSSDSDVVRTIATRFNLGGLLSEEVCSRAGVKKNMPVAEAGFEEINMLLRAMKETFSPLQTGKLGPCIIKKGEGDASQPIDVVPFELEVYHGLTKECFPSFNKALDEYFGKREAASVTEQIIAVKKEKTDILERRLKQQEEAVEKYGKESEKQTSIAESIYANYQAVEDVLNVLSNARGKGYSWDQIRSTIKAAKDSVPAARSILSIDPATGTVVLDIGGVRTNIDVTKTVPQNAQVYYERSKKLSKKQEGAIRSIEQTKLAMQKKERPAVRKSTVRIKKHWYDKFRWFISSDGFLVIGGRDADTNEEIFAKYMEKRDIVLHTQMPGAPLTVIKTSGKEVSPQTIEEAACFVVSYSSIWKSGQFSADCYWVNPTQVSKTPESGEYVKKGSFIIRGERNYLKDVPVGVAVGIEMGEETRVIGGPISAISGRAKHVMELIPGKFNQNDIAKKIYRKFVDAIGDASFVKRAASPDKIAMMLPPGESDFKT
ncbi:ribosome rescue protein RqcH [Methanomethylovorans sp.]|uniref:ribosome rescue protein RqcH n=1 Tax=Methanomethylovorans sp. TaxID=2758717 RepID=UPI001BD6BF25|nr:ribosome rescue protein RqcH [Methanomethylovorans sp.]